MKPWSLILSATLIFCLGSALLEEARAQPLTPTATPTLAPIAPYNPPQPIAELNSVAMDYAPHLTGDLLEIFFISSRAGEPSIWSASRAAVTASWGSPFPVTELSSGDTEWYPVVSRDGLEVIFASHRGLQPTNTWNRVFRSTRPNRSAPWSPPTLVPELNPPEIQDHFTLPHWLSADSLRIYTSRRFGLDYDLYMSNRSAVGQPFSGPTPVAGVNTELWEASCSLAEDERSIVFGRMDGVWKLYGAGRQRIGDAFVGVSELPELNTSESDTQVGFGAGNLCSVWLSSNRGYWPGQHDLYVAANYTPLPAETATPTRTYTPTPTITPSPTWSTDVCSPMWSSQ